MADYDGRTGELRALYVTPFLDENLLKEDYTGPGPLLAWYVQDGLGSIRQLVSNSNKVFNSYAYTAWGVPSNWHEKVSNRYTYTSREYNPETHLYHYRLREYTAREALFLTTEKARFVRNYRYCLDNPLLYIDPFGEHEQRLISELTVASVRRRRGRMMPIPSEKKPYWIPRIRVTFHYWLDCFWKGDPRLVQRCRILREDARNKWRRVGIYLRFVEVDDDKFLEILGISKAELRKRQEKAGGFEIQAKDVSALKRANVLWVIFGRGVGKQLAGRQGLRGGTGWIKDTWIVSIDRAWGARELSLAHEIWHLLSWNVESKYEVIFYPGAGGLAKGWTGPGWLPSPNLAPGLDALRIIWRRLEQLVPGGGQSVWFEPQDFPTVLFLDAFTQDPHTNPPERLRAELDWIMHEIKYWKERLNGMRLAQ